MREVRLLSKRIIPIPNTPIAIKANVPGSGTGEDAGIVAPSNVKGASFATSHPHNT